MSIDTAKRQLTPTQRLSEKEFLGITQELLPPILLKYQLATGSLHYHPRQLATELGFAESELQSEYFEFLDQVHPEDQEPLKQWLTDKETRETKPSSECRLQTKSGVYQNYVVTIHKTVANDGLVLLASRSETKQNKLAELKYIKKETEKVLAFGTFEYSIEDQNLRCSFGLKELLGYGHADYSTVFASFRCLLHQAVTCRYEAQLEDGQQGDDYTVELDLLNASGLAKKLRLIGRAVLAANNTVIKHIGLVHDITEKHRQEVFLKEAIEELRRSNKDLEEFAYIASHDLQEPLRKITAFSERLTDQFANKLDDEGRIYIQRIHQSANNMRTLIDDLLEFSRISTANEPHRSVNLNFVLQQVRNDLELNIAESGAVISSQSLPEIHGSLSQLKQLFNNLINNAIKFSKPGERPVIDIQCHTLPFEMREQWNLDRDKSYHSLEFCDNGIGFDEAFASRIFQVFQRLHGKSEYPGSGVGLAICKKIVAQHGGVIFAKNLQERGSCFTIILPAL